jgi:hypothetical protein
MTVIPFGEWRPDLSDYQAETTRFITNAAPRADGYGPLKEWQTYTQALPGPCRGAFLAVDDSGTPTLYAGTATRLYRMSNSTLGWLDISKGGGAGGPGYEAAPLRLKDNWTFTQFNNHIVACQINVPPQHHVGAASTFVDIPGAPPFAAYCAVVQSQVVLSGLQNLPHKIHWCARDDITEWDLAVNGADEQEFPDGGAVMGVAGGEFGVLFQESAIRRMTYLPNDERVFQFDRIVEGEGLRAPYSVVSAGSRVFFLGTAGFQMIMGGSPPVNISKERFQRFFNADWDSSAMNLMQGVNEPNSSRVWFFYKSLQGAAGLFNRAILYDWVLERPTYIDAYSGECAAMMTKPGITLDTLDTIGFTSIDTMVVSLDSFQSSPGALLGIFGPDHALGFMSGQNVAATLSTSEQAFEQRYFVSQIRPCSDDGSMTTLIVHRARLQDTPQSTAPSLVNVKGFCPHRIDTRMARMVSTHAYAALWTYDVGVEPLLVNTGKL